MSAHGQVSNNIVLSALRKHIDDNFETQSAYALSLHVSPSYVSDVLNGRREIPSDWVFNLGYRKSGWERFDQWPHEHKAVDSIPPMQAPLPTVADAEAAIDIALCDALKAVNVLATMLRKTNLQGFAVADEIAGSIIYAQKMRVALAKPMLGEQE